MILKVLDTLKYNDLNSPELFSSNVDKVSSEISTKAYLREKLLKYQRAFPIKFGKGKKFTIIEGRDIATVVFPKAKYKIFMWADPKSEPKEEMSKLKKMVEILALKEFTMRYVLEIKKILIDP